MLKPVLVKALLLLSGVLAALLITELTLDIAWGLPRTRLFQDHNKTYYYYEPYLPYFRAKRDGQGRIVCTSQRHTRFSESFVLKKPPSLKRVFIIGESVAGRFGDSKEYLRTVLHSQIPSCDFEVINAATAGYDSIRIIPVAEEIVRYEPDLVLIFMGNNLWDIPFPKNAWLSNAAFRYWYERSWTVRELFLRFLSTPGREQAGDRNTHFRNNYERIVQLLHARGIPVVLFRLPANLRDAPPTRYTDFFDAYRMPVQIAMEKGDYRKMLSLLSKMKATKDFAFASDPYVYFMMGKAHEKLGEHHRAKELYQKALTLDADPGLRCDPVRNGIIGDIAKKYDCPLVDIDALFAAAAPDGMPGDDFFIDFCHWYIPLNTMIVHETVRRIHAYNATHDRSILAGNSRWNYTLPARDPFTLPGDGEIPAQSLYYRGIESAIQYRFEESVYCFQRVFRAAPDVLGENDTLNDTMRRASFRHGGDYVEANRIPSAWDRILCAKGEVYRRNGEYRKALGFFQRSIQKEPSQTAAYLLKGLTYRAMKDETRARQAWAAAASRNRNVAWLLDMP